MNKLSATPGPYRQPAPNDADTWINLDDEARLWAAIVANMPTEASVYTVTKRADDLVEAFRARRQRGEEIRTAKYQASLRTVEKIEL